MAELQAQSLDLYEACGHRRCDRIRLNGCSLDVSCGRGGLAEVGPELFGGSVVRLGDRGGDDVGVGGLVA